jgi:hypothetical protein
MVARWLCWMLAGTGMLLAAAEPFSAGEALPEIVAAVDGHPIRRGAVIERLRGTGVFSPDNPPEIRKAAVRRAAESEIYFYLLGRLLATEKIVPSEEAAALHLAELQRVLPRGLPELNRSGLMLLAASEHYRWNVALEEYLRRVAPEVIAVSDAEVERLYRVNQEQFRLPEQYQLGMIRILKSVPGAKERAETVRSRMRQGEEFDRVAAEVDPEGSRMSQTNLLELLRQGNPAAPEGSVSRVLEDSTAYYLVKIRSKTPGRFVPFEEIAPYLRLQLVSDKTAAALEAILRGELKKAKVKFFIDQ